MSGCEGTNPFTGMPLRPNLFNLTHYDCKYAVFAGPPLSTSYGYGLVIGIGALFSILVPVITLLDSKYGGVKQSGELFATGGRSMRSLYVSSVMTSQWVWGATLFLAPAQVFACNSVSGPFWYATGAAVQLPLMGIVSYQLRRFAPKARTLGEAVKHRWGSIAHLTTLFFFLFQNLTIGALLNSGGATNITAMTGMTTMAASYLKGIWIFIFCLIMAFGIFASPSSDILGSPTKVYDTIREADGLTQGDGGSLLSFFSHAGLVFGCVNFFVGFGALFTEQNYWQYGIAARTSACNYAWLIAGFCWFTIPWVLGTSAGLGAVALNLPLSISEIFNGGVVTGTAQYLYGNSGVAMALAAVIMTVSSGVAGEIIAMSSVVTYDIYKMYFKPHASDSDCLFWQRLVVIVYGCLIGVTSIIAEEIPWDGGFQYTTLGLLTAAPVASICAVVAWRRGTSTVAISATVAGLALGILTWCVTAQGLYSEVTPTTLGANYPVIAGTSVALVLPFIIFLVGGTLMSKQRDNYNWSHMATAGVEQSEQTDSVPEFATAKSTVCCEEGTAGGALPRTFDRYNATYAILAVSFTILYMVVWPALTLPAGRVWSRGYFTFYVILMIILLLVAAFLCIFGPLIQYRSIISGVCKAWRKGDTPVVLATQSGKLEVLS